MINFQPVGKIIGLMLVIIGVLMLTGIPFSLYYGSEDHEPLLKAGLLNIILGLPIIWNFYRSKGLIRKREGYLIVALGWLTMVTAGMTPYLFSGVVDNTVDAFFETVSGMTTTGATIFEDIESLPAGILYWRSLTQWIGGMGIIVLTVAIFPLLGIGGIELFVAEAPGPTSDKLHPRISETAKRLWLIYVSLTGVLCLILALLGMSFYDAINHAFTTMATGGFSTKNSSMAHFTNPAIQYVIILFMFIAGTNYTILFFAITGRLKNIWNSEEFKIYGGVVLVLALGFTWSVFQHLNIPLEQAFRESLFQVVSLITTTGFISADYSLWSPSAIMVCFVLLFAGASAGSTSGGIKMIRHLVFFKNSFMEFRRIIHPRAITSIKVNGQSVKERVITHINTFLLLYLMLFVMGCVIVSILGLDFTTAAGAVATSLGNVGPGIGKVGPTDNFAWLSPSIKLVLSFLMLLGRLELFTILVLFSPYFWKSN